MTTRNFDALFNPKAIALIGASNQEGSVGAVLARNLFGGEFAGPIMPVNPREKTICSAVSYQSVAELPETPDLAIIATPPVVVPSIVAELAAKGCRAAIVITAGFGEGGAGDSTGLRQQLLDAARPHLMRIVGPNCLGFLSPARGLNASFAHLTPKSGDIAFVTQSGAIATSILDWATGRGVGFSHIVSLGDMSDIDFGDMLDHLALDSQTKSILLYVENVTQARKFMSAARIAARAKPVIVVKSGRSSAGARAATSHSGALAGSDAVYDAAFRRAGMLRVDDLRALFDAAETLASGVRVSGDRLAILTNGGGLGVMAVDALEAAQGRLADLSSNALAALNATLPPTWSHANPVDILGDARCTRYAEALDILATRNEQDAILVMNCPTGVSDNMSAAQAIIEVHKATPKTPLLACWMGAATASAPRGKLSEAKIPNFETPEEAARAFMHLAEYDRNQKALLQTPAASADRAINAREAVNTIFRSVLSDGRTILTEPEAKAVLSAYGVPVVETVEAKTPEDAATAANRISGPKVLKILSRDITHKSDVGGVKLNLIDADAVEAAAREMRDAVSKKQPKARIDGFTVQAMISHPKAEEVIIGVSQDRTFGPVMLVGHGGVAVETIADRAMGLPPLNSVLALDMLKRTRIAKLLAGYRDVPPADIAAVVEVMTAISDLVVDHPELAELDINPLLVDSTGVIALDARIVVQDTLAAPEERLAIRPYPAAMEHDFTVTDGASFHLRPIRPQDAVLLLDMAKHTSREDLRLRFHGAVRDMSEAAAARLSQIDYDREMALVACDPQHDGAIIGVARLVFDPNFAAAEYAIIVRSDYQNRGIGRRLMSEMLDYARARGAKRVWGDVLAENGDMLETVRAAGGASHAALSAGDAVRTEFALS